MGQLSLLRTRRFAGIFWTQFFGAFNDNLLKNALVILITYRSLSVLGLSSENLVALCGGLFILPFFLFSATAGELADRFAKHTLVRAVKVGEIGIMAALGPAAFRVRWTVAGLSPNSRARSLTLREFPFCCPTSQDCSTAARTAAGTEGLRPRPGASVVMVDTLPCVCTRRRQSATVCRATPRCRATSRSDRPPASANTTRARRTRRGGVDGVSIQRCSRSRSDDEMTSRFIRPSAVPEDGPDRGPCWVSALVLK